MRLLATLSLLLACSCSQLAGPAQTAADAAQLACQSELLRSAEAEKLLLASGVLPAGVGAAITTACGQLDNVQAILDAADTQRAPRVRLLIAEMRSRGLL